MKNISIIAISIICFILVGCENKNNSIKDINAEYYSISYGQSIYDAKDKVDEANVKSLVEKYNNIELTGTTNQEINYDKAITIIFIYKDQISGLVTIDDKGICRIDDDLKNYIISDESNIYEDAVEVYDDLKDNYES